MNFNIIVKNKIIYIIQIIKIKYISYLNINNELNLFI